ncbi:MAG: aspartate 1-decarboxylase [Clostridium sp.]|nr:aspartate 1-decarboxylase [Clostridium sp.]MCM1547267.1 aspartate 1-decarboxylase [Ruminococcus sp.]
MTVTMLKSKIHRAVVTEADLNYVGSVTVDSSLMKAAGIFEYEKVQVVNVTNGSRIETYAICGEADSGVICLNGAAARCASVGDIVIIMAYAQMSEEEAEAHKPWVVLVGEKNSIAERLCCEKHGDIR